MIPRSHNVRTPLKEAGTHPTPPGSFISSSQPPVKQTSASRGTTHLRHPEGRGQLASLLAEAQRSSAAERATRWGFPGSAHGGGQLLLRRAAPSLCYTQRCGLPLKGPWNSQGWERPWSSSSPTITQSSQPHHCY